jgi:hypothetical protein
MPFYWQSWANGKTNNQTKIKRPFPPLTHKAYILLQFSFVLKAMDVLVSTLANCGLLLREGTIETLDLLPISGFEKFEFSKGNSICSPLEVYSVDSLPYVFLLQRSIPSKGRLSKFADDLTELLLSWGIRKIVLLSGASWSDAFEESVPKNRIFVAWDSQSSFLIDFPRLCLPSASAGCFEITGEDWNSVKGSSLALLLSRSSRISVLVIGKFSSDGNNSSEGTELAVAAAGIASLPVHLDTHTQPQSWEFTFGPSLQFSRETSRNVYH